MYRGGQRRSTRPAGLMEESVDGEGCGWRRGGATAREARAHMAHTRWRPPAEPQMWVSKDASSRCACCARRSASAVSRAAPLRRSTAWCSLTART